MQLNFSHQRKIFEPESARPVTVIGIGSVGSKVVVGLVNVGAADITVYDHDHVSSHNVSMSAYRRKDVSRYKTVVLAEIIEERSGVIIKTECRAYTDEPLRGSVVACVDTMEARMDIWKAVRENPFVDAFIDTRVSEVMTSIFAVCPHDPADIEHYERFLYPSSEAKRQMCGEHSIGYVTDIAAALACHQLTLAWTGGRMVRHQYGWYGQKPRLSIPGEDTEP